MPPSVGQPGYYGLQVGAIWGIGHGISAMILGLCAFALKGKLTGRFSFIERLTVLAESAVGISLLAIGILGIRENIQGGDVHAEYSSSDNDDGGIGGAKAKTVPKRAIFANGILHGFSLDGAPSIAPAIAFSSWNNAITFLLAYCIGTMGTMSLAAAILGETSMRIGKAANDPELPRRLSMISSGIAILIGLFWIAKTTILK